MVVVEVVVVETMCIRMEEMKGRMVVVATQNEKGQGGIVFLNGSAKK